MGLLEQVDVVLVEPGEGGNVGSCARALKNTGIQSLKLVSPQFTDNREARKMAVHAADLLDKAEIHESLESAVASATWVVGCTARPRDNSERKRPLDLDAFLDRLGRLDPKARVALVFGSERTGLTNNQLGICQDILSLPTDPDYPVLNLAQAVMVVAWEIRRRGLRAANAVLTQPPRQVVLAEHVDGLISHLRHTLEVLGYLNLQNPTIVLDELRRVFGRAELSPRELQMLRGILHQMDVYIAKHGGPPTPNQPRGPGCRGKKKMASTHDPD